jgi:hypothetical protein
MSNTITFHGEERHVGEGDIRRERLMNNRDALLSHVRAQRTTLSEALARKCNEGRGSAKALWQMMAAIRGSEGQIALIDGELDAIDTP